MIKYDLTDPLTLAEPYEHYALLRREAPFFYSESMGVWLASRFDDCNRILRDPQVFSQRGNRTAFPLMSGDPDKPTEPRTLAHTDPPVHTLLRRMVNRGFTPHSIRAWEPRIRAIADLLVDDMLERAAGGEADFVTDVANRLPALVIAEILDLPWEDCDNFQRWSAAVAASFVPGSDPEVALRDGREMYHYFEDLVERKRKNPGQDDVLSVLLTKSSSSEDPLDTEELASLAALLMVAGNETTANLLGNWAARLLIEPELERTLRADPTLIAQSFEESLRHEAPASILFREMAAPAEVQGVRLEPGDRVGIMYGSANRDEDHWGIDADKYVLNRPAEDHIAFGFGVHFCLGATLVRMEARVTAESLFERTRGMQQRGEIERTCSVAIRGCTSIPVTVTA